jgi:O-antigen/teichoic acid export membrane protein
VLIIDPDQLLLYTTVSIYVVGQSAYYAFGAVFVGLQRVSDRVVTGLIGPLVLLLLVPLGVWNGMSFRGVLLIYALSSIVMLAFTAKALSRHINVSILIPSRRSVKKTLSSALPIFTLMALALIHARIDEIMLAIYRDYEEVAIYAAGYKLLEVSRMVVRPVTMVLFPVLAAAAASRAWFEFRSSASKLVWGSLAAGAVIAITMVFLSAWIVPLAFGDSYGKTITVTQVLFLSAPALFLGHSVILIANSLNRIKEAIVILTCSVVGNTLLNALVIPIYGAIGAAWTTLITESMAALGILVVIKLVLRRKVELSGG